MECSFHKDTPIYTPESSTVPKYVIFFDPVGPGKYNRPQDLARAKQVNLHNGELHFLWPNGKVSVVTASAIESYAYMLGS